MVEERLLPEDWPRAIAETDGRQLIVAGPGTGKSEFLVRRVDHLVSSGACGPNEIAVLSFSRRSAGRLRERIEKATGVRGIPVDVSTFHSLALRLLESSDAPTPSPLTTPEQLAVVRELLAEEDPGDWPVLYRGILDSRSFSAEVADFLLRCSERMLDPAALTALADQRADWRGLPGLFARYLAHLAENGRTDYGVLLTAAVEVLAGDEGPSRFRYVLIDEYQDTTPAQAAMAELLAKDHGNLTVSGDPYQSIFSFRGAELRNIADFADQPDTRRTVLARSFRVPAEILDAALRIVSGGELPGTAGPVDPAPHQGRSETYLFDQETAEAEWIAREVEHLIRSGSHAPSDIAVVVRSKRHLLSELSRALERRSVPHQPPESRLVDHPAVRIVDDLVIASASGGSTDSVSPTQVADADRAMRRILLGPLFEVPVGLEREMSRLRSRLRLSWAEVVARFLPERPGLIALLSDDGWAVSQPATEGFWHLWMTLDGLPEIVHAEHREDWRRAWTAFAQTLSRQADRDPTMTLERFFRLLDDEFEASPLLSHTPGDDRVSLTTLHQVKGLEFDIVFIASAVEGVFPDLRRSRRMLRPELLSPERTVDGEAQHVFQLQEEMRLAYTAMTRARRRVVWTATRAGVDQGERRPSRFLLAAAGGSEPGAPTPVEADPITITEAETRLRRDLLDPTAPSSRRTAAAQVLAAPPQPWWDSTRFAGAPAPGPDGPILGERIRLSPSQAESYERCPRRYALERRLRLGDTDSVYSQFGILVHEILERAEAEVLGTGKRHAELPRVLEIVDEVWEQAEFGTAPLNDAWKRKAEALLERLYERWPGKGEPEAVEVAVESTIGGIEWVGRIDRLERTEDGLRVVDYKTGTRAPKVDDAAESLQLGFYAEAVQRSRGTVVASEMWFPRVDSVGITVRKLDMHRLDDLTTKLTELAEAIAGEKWEPRVSSDCQRCGFRRSCPAWPEGRGAFLS